MKTTFVCLANSKKYGERCIAGVEIVDFDGSNYSIVISASQPKWIRPVSKGTHGAVSANLVRKVGLLDVVEIEMVSVQPQGYQAENILFDERRWEAFSGLDMALFTDLGSAAARFSDLEFADRKAYGIGLRFNTFKAVFLRLDVAGGGNEGIRMFLKFSGAF